MTISTRSPFIAAPGYQAAKATADLAHTFLLPQGHPPQISGSALAAAEGRRGPARAAPASARYSNVRADQRELRCSMASGTPKHLDRFSSVNTRPSRPVASSEPRDPAHQVLPPAEVQARRGLVEEQQFRVGHQRAGDLDPLALPLR